MSSRTALSVEEDIAMPGDEDAAPDESTADAEAPDGTELPQAEEAEDGEDAGEAADSCGFPWRRTLLVAIPAIALLLALGVGYLRWLDGTARESRAAADQSIHAASDGTIAMLSYKPETVDQQLNAAAGDLAEPFREQYLKLVNEVVAPGAKQQHISVVATVPAAASVTATGKHAVVLVFVDQTTTIGTDAPTQSTSSVRVNLDKVGGRWLISQFDPV